MSDKEIRALDGLTPTQKYLLYFSKFHAKPSVTVLMKLCYLLDLTSIKESDVKLTRYDYYRYSFGPFDNKIYADLEALVTKGLAVPATDYTTLGTEVVYYKVNEEVSDKVILEGQGAELAAELLDAVKGYGAKELTQIAYKTKPMLKLGATLGGNEHLMESLDLKAV